MSDFRLTVDEIKLSIMRGVLKSGARIIQHKGAATLNVSQTTIREALVDLEHIVTRLDLEFHRALWPATGNDRILELIRKRNFQGAKDFMAASMDRTWLDDIQFTEEPTNLNAGDS